MLSTVNAEGDEEAEGEEGEGGAELDEEHAVITLLHLASLGAGVCAGRDEVENSSTNKTR